MTTDHRSVRIERVAAGRYVAHNERGATIAFGGEDFSPVELLLAAIGGCTAIDTDIATSRRTEPTSFTVTVSGDKVSDRESGNRMENLSVTFAVRFPDGEQGDAARAMLPRTVALSHDKLCTVSRTVELGTPVRTVIE
ncbi:putative OsmC-like protein [Saccharomonospora amisosensis]|uniref:Putative OsmC-like protein n=1 Tax=Saccharomonospora amisosensis TaxID=1128677 RepID=A0A7X5UQA4_9PSEU|nr:OsmC family protein [Saccharomonospora amisosensis]NIJ11917.1 putative OsmC-like protein [Saccharomonospora amisosensis]